jgi:aryl-alcohol dehydrogenase-like predicted oxidoreductase
VFAWSAQARGFFTDRLAAGTAPDPELLRVYDSEGNRERLRRARELASRHGVTANDVALAWVLHQPFPTYAVIGPRTVAELRSSVRALEVELTAAEARWLDLDE